MSVPHTWARGAPFAVFFLALVLRFALFAGDDGTLPKTGDAPRYFALAQSLRAGTGLSFDGETQTSQRMPGYPLFEAVILSLPGSSLRTVQAAQIILDSLTCVLVFFLARHFLGFLPGLLSGCAAALYVPLASFSIQFMSETLFTFFLVAAVYVLAVAGLSHRGAIMGGVLCGLATLVRPNGIFIAVFLGMWMVFPLSKWRKRIVPTAVYASAFMLVLSPWILRNARLFGAIVPTTTRTGITTYNSYLFPEEGPGFNEVFPPHTAYYSIENEAEASSYLLKATAEHIARHPLETLKTIPIKTSLLVYPFDLEWFVPWSPLRFNPFFFAVFCFGIAGVLFRRRFPGEIPGIFLYLFISLAATSLLLYSSPRLRLPYDPFLIILAAAGFLTVRNHPRSTVMLAGFTILLVFLAAVGESEGFLNLLRSFQAW